MDADDVVLDIASGDGYGANILAKRCACVVGVDISRQAVADASSKYQRNNLSFMVGSADSIPLESGSVDAVVSFETLEHHDKHDEMMREIKRVLRSEGILIISTPDKQNYSDNSGLSNPYHVKELYRDEFLDLLGKYFTIVKCASQKAVFGSVIIPDGDHKDYAEYIGDYSSIAVHHGAKAPLYHLCIAADVEPSVAKLNTISYFDGWPAMRLREEYLSSQHENEINAYRNSCSYKLGRLILSPFRFLKNQRDKWVG